MYPTDAVANLNAGAVALSQKDLDAAVKFMEKAYLFGNGESDCQ
jgi:hypothetical protein